MLEKIFRQTAVPPEHHNNFLHLYLDIGWFGILSGSAINFLNIYAARIGATGLQIGLINAMPAVVTMFLAIPAGHWLQRQNTGRTMFWSSIFYRIGFFPFIFLPWFLSDNTQVVTIIVLTFLMAIPLTPLGVGFNALFAEVVPEKYRAHVAGIRNAMLAITYMLASVVSGKILDNVPFPIGYQIVFGIGAFGAAMSSYHLYFIIPPQSDSPALPSQTKSDSLKRLFSRSNIFSSLRLDIWKTDFKKILLALGGYHLAQTVAVPLYPLYYVYGLNLNDDQIGIGTALFYLTALIGSTQLKKFVGILGNKNVTGWGVAGLSIYPFVLSLSNELWEFYGISLFGGLIFAMANGAFINYMLEHIPAKDRPSHLAWYNILLNAGILIGSLGGPAIAEITGLVYALMLSGLFRLIAGIYIIKWG
jgi:MFS family permease